MVIYSYYLLSNNWTLWYFPVFFGMYMSVHKWKGLQGRFLGFENYQKILGDISSFGSLYLG